MATNNNVKDSKAGIIAHIIGALAFIAVGVCLIVLDATMISTIVYSFSVLVMGIFLICFGAYYMIKFFFNKEYVKISNYGFTMGVILVIIGAVFIFRADSIAAFIDSIVSLIGVVFGAIMLQQAFALFHIQRSSWFLSLILGIAAIASSIYTLVNHFTFFDGSMESAVFLIAIGAVSLFSLLLMLIGLRDHKKDSERMYNRNIDDAPLTSKSSSESIFEEETTIDESSSESITKTSDEAMFDE